MNERLAQHYGIAGVKGPEFRRVELADTHARRGPDARERPDGVLLRDAHLAGAARQVDPREHAERAAARPARRRAAARRGEGRRRRAAAAAARGAPHQRRSARPATSGWTRSASRSRTTTRSARGATQDGKWPIDASGTLPDGRSFTGAPGLASVLRQDREAFARARHRQAADLRARPRPRALRPADGGRDRAAARGERLSLLGARAGDREEPAVPAAERRGGVVSVVAAEVARPADAAARAWARAWRCRRSTP